MSIKPHLSIRGLMAELAEGRVPSPVMARCGWFCIALIDKLASHKGKAVRTAISSVGARLIFL